MSSSKKRFGQSSLRKKIKYVYRIRKSYKNFFSIILSVLKNQFPITVILKNGDKISLNNLYQLVFLAMDDAWRYCRINEDQLIISKNNIEVKFIDWENNGDIHSVFINESYSRLPVDNKIVVDVGASIGDSSIYFSLRGAKQVIALEPAPKNYFAAKTNIELNKLSNIILLLAGCSGKDTIKSIDPEIASNGPFTESVNGTKVPMITLDEIIHRYKIDSAVLKLDCEGYEYDIILNTNNETLRKFNHIFLEYHVKNKNKIFELGKKLESAGFQVKIGSPQNRSKIGFEGYIDSIRK